MRFIKRNYIKKVSKGRALLYLVIFLTVTIVSFIYLNRRNDSSKQEMLHIKSKIDKLAVIPKDEEPSLATITDKTKITDSSLSSGENGDKVLLFYKAKKVFLYRPSVDKIVTISPLILDPSSNEVEGSRILVKNGGGNNLESEKLRTRLQEKYPSAKVSMLEQASRQNYPQTIVIDLTEGTKYNLVANLIQHLGAQRGVLPTGEVKPENSDILIIVGLK